ncbi:hypothetical protein B2J93_1763 [Marssonina coronariae]|uniref:Uncharacterized protein n=1 Tax=Diplocarpon coronariae TaxID=2795749 RepID=A0A218ZD77_9HELO|nr:hypothetical protein B2J93_1763 [Marssonina coronariae]
MAAALQSRSASGDSTRSSASLGRKIVRAAREHHQSVTSAYSSLYAAGYQAGAGASARPSGESQRETEARPVEQSPLRRLARAAKRHHRDMDAAYGLYYGAGWRAGARA